MYIESVRLRNHRSHFDTTVHLASGLNLLMGPNNAGKSTLLSTLRGALPKQPSVFRGPGGPVDPEWPADGDLLLSLVVEREEIERILIGTTDLVIAAPPEEGRAAAIEAFAAWMDTLKQVRLTIRVPVGSGDLQVVDPAFGLWSTSGPREKLPAIALRRDANGKWSVYGGNAPNGNMLAARLVRHFRENISYFAPERSAQSTWDTPEAKLSPDSRNLVGVLERIKGTRKKFDRFVELVQRVLPEVRDVSIVRESSKAEIRVWFHDPASEAVAQAIPAHECGSGMRQVLGILAGVVESESGQVLLIDEPQSYLHPGALRRLLDVVRESKVSQCVLATHAIETVNRPEVACLVHMELVDARTRATSIRLHDVSSLRHLMDSVGARPGDAYGADAVLWVEGPSEVGVFRTILESRSSTGTSRRAIAVLPVAHACKVSGKAKSASVDEILGIYERVGGVDALLPRVSGFIFDNDGRSVEDRRMLHDRRRGQIVFTSRTMLENYLLDGRALVETIASHFAAEEIDLEAVAAFVGRKLMTVDIVRADGAKVISEIFVSATDARLSYDKVVHAPELARRLLARDEGSLDELWTLAVSAIEGTAVRP